MPGTRGVPGAWYRVAATAGPGGRSRSSAAPGRRTPLAELGPALALGGSGPWPDRPRTGARFTAFEPFHRWALAARERLGGA
ncbi:MAG TPA: hypothetical protein VEB43_16220 [Anaeromyxobacter sp.]|nr:hypothetical protein [Anaeromyxobacter sp.]